MSTDKLQAIQNTVEEILGEPASPRTFFDEEADATQAGEQVAKVSDNLRLSTEIAKENVGRPTSRKFGISPNENFEADIARQALADQIPGAPQGDAGNQLLKQLSKLSHETASPRSDLHTTGMNMS